MAKLKEVDIEVFKAIKKEEKRQREHIEFIASEKNMASDWLLMELTTT